MLIVEGPDCVGKTRLAKELTRRLNSSEVDCPHTYHHLSRLHDDFDRYWDYHRIISPYIVQDRLHMSEPLYEAARDEQPGSHGLTPERYRQVDGLLRLNAGFTVLMVMDPKHAEALVKSRWDESREMYDMKTVLRVNELYVEMMQNRRDGMTWNDYTMDVDCVVMESEEKPFYHDDFVDHIIERYMRRVTTLVTTASDLSEGRNLCRLH